MTYSIVARDPTTGELGVAVQSHFLAAGSSVPGALAGVGAVATQANVRAAYRTDGLRMLAHGSSADEALAACLADDAQSEVRQVAMVDTRGNVAAHTGSGCWNAASHHIGHGFCAQANTVASTAIPEAMASAYESAAGPFAERLLAALDAAEALGGDLRGRQSAAIRVVAGEPPPGGEGETLLDLRVDNHSEPLVGLRSAVGLALAFAPMWDVIRGPACRGPVAPTPTQSRDAMTVLDRAQRTYGPRNLEPTFWKAVALWRASQQGEASQAVQVIARSNPGWAVLFDDVVSRWPIP